ncbi:MAG TPA: prolyl oligopeptidase family serine peptidase [Chthonomonadaceae bacterium]|nr:prolyl oligopeptidase family serine peptidase [Chthonomonadaceae bacterium]
MRHPVGLLIMVALFIAPFSPVRADEPQKASNTSPSGENNVNHPASESSAQRQPRQNPGGGLVFKDHVTPYWFADNTRFWYRNDLKGGAKEFILVDVEKGVRKPAFDAARLAAALSKAAGQEFSADRLPFDTIALDQEGKLVRFEAGGKSWQCDLASYACAPSDTAFVAPTAPRRETPPQAKGLPLNEAQPGEHLGGPGRPVSSPDGKWSAVVREHNVYVHPLPEGQEFALTQDGQEGKSYDRLQWSPDSHALVGWQIEPGDHKEVYLIRTSPPGGGRAQLRTRPYDLPGDTFTHYALSVFDVANRKQIRPQVDPYEHEWEPPHLWWNADGRRFDYDQEDRGHQRLREIEVDSLTGATRTLIDEKTDTFIWTAHTENLNMTYVNHLQKTEEIIYVSERDGWRHLYLVDAKAGAIKNQITKGDWVVRGIDRIDEEKRQVWFRASGRNPDQDPYFIHYYRINFDGTGLVALTEGNGTHRIDYSPDRKYLIDTYSRVDMAPVTELRRVSDGKLVSKLEEADIAALKATGWKPPEVFVAKGRDGKTDIWGIICRPKNFDPAKKYPVLEQIYSGPQGAYVPKAFSPIERFTSMTELGFIVVQMDGMGTAFRSKAFHDICWKNLKDAGFPDRILWHKAAAAKYPYYDITRVGIYGTSAGGQNAAAAVLFHPEFYKAAVANSGCHDNRMDKASWNEQWMGYPVGPQYAESSNIDNAARLGGNLLLIVGELDTNVPPESTLRFADALMTANKDFDMLVVPGADHGITGPHNAYAQRRTRDFFVRHLLGQELPTRNASP